MEMRPTAGITIPKLATDPMATEGEMTAGPDDYVPYDDDRVPEEVLAELDLAARSPAEGPDDFDIEPHLPRF